MGEGRDGRKEGRKGRGRGDLLQGLRGDRCPCLQNSGPCNSFY